MNWPDFFLGFAVGLVFLGVFLFVAGATSKPTPKKEPPVRYPSEPRFWDG